MLTWKQICTFEEAVTGHIWDFVLRADINKFPEAMQRDNHLRETTQSLTWNIMSKWMPVNRDASRTTEAQHNRMDSQIHRHAETYVQILRPIHPMYTIHVFVSILSLVYLFFSSSVCQSVRPSVYISPLWQPACSPPPMLFTEMTPVWKFFTLFSCLPQFNGFLSFLPLVRDALSWNINVSKSKWEQSLWPQPADFRPALG